MCFFGSTSPLVYLASTLIYNWVVVKSGAVTGACVHMLHIRGAEMRYPISPPVYLAFTRMKLVVIIS